MSAGPALGGPELVEVPCPACGATRGERMGPFPAEPPAPAGPWTLVRCEACRSVFLSPRPVDPAALYSPGYHVHRDPGGLGRRVRTLAARREARLAARLVAPPADVFEIGCGTGEVLGALVRRGFRASGIEPSLAAARLARARGLAVEEGPFTGGRGVAGGYDLVLAAHVLEHVPSPPAFLTDLRRILRPGGLALLKVPVAGAAVEAVFGGHSGSFDLPYHLCVPSREALKAAVDGAGLELVRAGADPVPNDWVHGLRKSLSATLGFRVPFIEWWNPLVALPFVPPALAAAVLGAPSRLRVVLRKPA